MVPFDSSAHLLPPSGCFSFGTLLVVLGLLCCALALAVAARKLWSAGSVVVAYRLSCSEASGIFWDQGSNRCPQYCRVDAQLLDHQGNPQSYVLNHCVLLPLQGTDSPSARPRKQGKQTALCRHKPSPQHFLSLQDTAGLVTEAPKGTLQCADSKDLLLALSHFRQSEHKR